MTAEKNGHVGDRSCPLCVTVLVPHAWGTAPCQSTRLPTVPGPGKCPILEGGTVRSHSSTNLDFGGQTCLEWYQLPGATAPKITEERGPEGRVVVGTHGLSCMYQMLLRCVSSPSVHTGRSATRCWTTSNVPW